MEKNKEQKKEEVKKSNKLAVVRVRGKIKVKGPIEDTMQLLRLYNNNFCVVLDNNEKIMGMVKKIKDYVTWGEIDDETFKLLVEKRAEEFKSRETDSKGKIKYDNKFMKIGDKKIKKYFRLNPPKKGFGRKGIKVAFAKGGALGNRKEKINDLLKRMI